MSSQITLHFTLPDGESHVTALSTTEPVVIGRSRDSTIKLNFPSVSRKHAQVVFERGVYWLEDLKSSNGTFVNQKQVRKARINVGDVLKCGDFILHVQQRGAEPPKPSSAQPQSHGSPSSVSQPPLRTQRGSEAPQNSTSISPVTPSRQPWVSKSPTQQPSSPQSIEVSHAPQSSSSPAKHVGGLIDPPSPNNSSQPPQLGSRAETLSNAYSEKQVQKRRELLGRPGAEHKPELHGLDQHTQSTSAQDVISSFESAPPSGNLVATLEAEVRRLKLSERDQQEMIEHLKQQNAQLVAEADESRAQALSLQAELDRSSQERQQESAQSGSKLDEVERLLREQSHQRDAFAEECQHLKRSLEQARHELLRQKLQAEEMMRQGGDAADQLSALISERDALRDQLDQQSAQLKSLNSGSTQIHVFSLPQPHQDSTSPDWARHLARFDHLMNEIQVVREHNRLLKRELKAQRSQTKERANLPHATTLSRGTKRESLQESPPPSISRDTSSFTSVSQPVVAATPHIATSAESAQDQDPSASEGVDGKVAQDEMKNTIEESAPSPLASLASQTTPQDHSELTEDVNVDAERSLDASTGESASSPHQKRAWRGML